MSTPCVTYRSGDYSVRLLSSTTQFDCSTLSYDYIVVDETNLVQPWGTYGCLSVGSAISGFVVVNAAEMLMSCVVNLDNRMSFMYEFTVTSAPVSVQYGYSGTAVGWLVCGSEQESLSPYALSYGVTNCTQNGVMWKLQYIDYNRYYTNAAMKSIAYTAADVACSNAIYNQVCDRVGSLPPYLCSKSVGQPFFTVLSTALANAHTLFLAGLSLSKLPGWFNKSQAQEEEIAVDDEKTSYHTLLVDREQLQ